MRAIDFNYFTGTKKPEEPKKAEENKPDPEPRKYHFICKMWQITPEWFAWANRQNKNPLL